MFLIVIAASNLFLDFDQIEKVHCLYAKFMEWFGAMGLMVAFSLVAINSLFCYLNFQVEINQIL
jgi:uncharacterized YccA/Bax inhibitor family protein